LSWLDVISIFLEVFFFSFLALCFGPAVIHRSCCCCQLFSQEGRKCARQKSPARKEYQRSRRSYKQRIGSACPSDCCWSDSTSIDNLLAIHRLFLSTPMFPVWLFLLFDKMRLH
jgi:hypothetical protein